MNLPDQISRRTWSGMVLTSFAGLLIPKGFAHTVAGSLVIGLQTYSLRDRSMEEAIATMVKLGVYSCEVWEGHVEPRELQWARNSTPEQTAKKKTALSQWRNALQLEKIAQIREQFKAAGIVIQAYNATIKDGISDHDLELIFKITKALGTDCLTTSGTVSVMPRVDVYAQKYKVKVGMHNHAHVDKPNEFASPDSFRRGMQGLSNYIRINLDIGHFTAANFDVIDFLLKNHEKIVCIHLKDRKRNQGPNLPFGEGDTPILAALKLINEKGWPIPANIEYEYNGADVETELRKCLTYCRNFNRQ